MDGRLLTVNEATAIGPQFAPMISGFVSPINWRWTFWIGLIIAIVSLIPIILLPETYAAVILRKRAERMRKEDPNLKAYAPIELEHRDAKEIVTIILARPLHMLFTEPIVFFSCLYLSFATGLYCTRIPQHPIQSGFLLLTILTSPLLRSLPTHLPRHLCHERRHKRPRLPSQYVPPSASQSYANPQPPH
jgi:MFS family permease